MKKARIKKSRDTVPFIHLGAGWGLWLLEQSTWPDLHCDKIQIVQYEITVVLPAQYLFHTLLISPCSLTVSFVISAIRV